MMFLSCGRFVFFFLCVWDFCCCCCRRRRRCRCVFGGPVALPWLRHPYDTPEIPFDPGLVRKERCFFFDWLVDWPKLLFEVPSYTLTASLTSH